MISNYFKVGKGQIYTFDDSDAESTQYAYERVRPFIDLERVSMWRMPTRLGPWDKLGLVGHRSTDEILADMQATTDDEERSILREEFNARPGRLLC